MPHAVGGAMGKILGSVPGYTRFDIISLNIHEQLRAGILYFDLDC